MQYCNLQCKIGILGQCWHRFWTLFDPFGWLVAFFPTRMHVRRPLEAKKAIKKFDPKIAYPPPTRPLWIITRKFPKSMADKIKLGNQLRQACRSHHQIVIWIGF